MADIMSTSLRFAIVALVLVGMAATRALAEPLVITGVTVVDAHSGELATDRTLVIDAGRIDAILAPEDTVPEGRRMAGDGKYVVPGFLDMHAHLGASADPDLTARLMLSRGITGFREMAGTAESLAARRAGRALPFPDAPEILAMPGEVLVGQLADTPEDARRVVREQLADGADFIKVVDLNRDTFLAALDEARAQGVQAVGHLPMTVDIFEATSAGLTALEHLGPRSSLLLNCSAVEPAVRREIEQDPPAGMPVLPNWLASLARPLLDRIFKRVVVNPVLINHEDEIALMTRILDGYSPERCRALAERLAAAGSWQVPTLIRIRTMYYGDAPEYAGNEKLAYMPEETRELWSSVSEDFTEAFAAADREVLHAFFEAVLALTGQMHAAGVNMLAGSDTPGGWVVPGFGLHQEFDLLAAAGIPPLAVLQMTTVNGARFLGREDNLGRVAAGYPADLVLLDGNPLASVQNLHDIHAVVRNGNYYDKAALEALRDGR